MLHGVGQERRKRGYVASLESEEIIFYRQGDVPWGSEGRLVLFLLVWHWFTVSYLERVGDHAGIRFHGVVLPLSHGHHYIILVVVWDREVQILVDGMADVVISQ